MHARRQVPSGLWILGNENGEGGLQIVVSDAGTDAKVSHENSQEVLDCNASRTKVNLCGGFDLPNAVTS
ncbi:MAG: hypothetical protein DLM70_13325 [Chloroflexi bacterium]|nr:MAG: hypothetical protein DLM70_13325 [Chloroflexota bacterium]